MTKSYFGGQLKKSADSRPRWTISDLAARLGITPQSLVASLKAADAPKPIGSTRKGMSGHLYGQYDPSEVFRWYRAKRAP